MVALYLFKALVFTVFIEISIALTTCPVPVIETAYTGANGAKFAICPDTDYQGTTLLLHKKIASTTACAKLCSQNPKCTKAVFDTKAYACHIKDSTADLTWATNQRYDVINLKIVDIQGTTITQCPSSVTTYNSKAGANYNICPSTDLRGRTSKVVRKITSATACAALCSTTQGCTKAVFDNIDSVCHIKDDSVVLTWVTNKRFDVIRLNVVGNNERKLGKWSDVIKLPVIPVAAYIVPQVPDSFRMLVFSAWGATTFGGAGGYTQFADYNFNTKAVSERQVANTNHDMFCPGISALADGRIIITGGSNAEATSIYSPLTNEFTRGPNMKVPRGYQTSATLSNGQVFTIGGSYTGPRGGKNGEVYNPATNTWKLLPKADVDPMLTVDKEGIWREDNHAWLFGWKNGSVFQAGPSKKQHWYGTSGEGSVVEAATRDDADAMCGINVMYDIGKILSTGGAQNYDNSPASARTHITTITNPGEPAAVERVPDMSAPRAFGNGVVLPDGCVVVTGGQRTAHVFTDTAGILAAEIFSPHSKTWSQLAPAAIARNYHSVSLLLPDGTVFSGGGGLCYVGAPGKSAARCNTAVNHADGQIFTPPYLFNEDNTPATRPVISSLSSHQIPVGGSVTVIMTQATRGMSFSLVRIGSATHSINSDQRRVPVSNVQSGQGYSLKLPTDSGILIPGYYYLFAMSPTGVPSIAKTVQITI